MSSKKYTRDEELTWARMQKFLTQKEAGEICGVSRNTFNRWESGERPMPIRKRGKFYCFLRLKPVDIPRVFCYDEEGYPIGFTPKLTYSTPEAEETVILARLKDLEGDDFKERQRIRELEMEVTFQMQYDSSKPTRQQARLIIYSQAHAMPLLRKEAPLVLHKPAVSSMDYDEGLDLV